MNRFSVIARTLWPNGWCRVSVAPMAALAVVLCVVPGLNLLGYYACLVIAVAAGWFAGFAGASLGVGARQMPRMAVARRALGASVGVVLVPVVILVANASRVRNCDLLEGLAFAAVGPLASAVVAGQVGALCGVLSSRRRRAMGLFALTWFLWAVRDLWVFYSGPAVYAFNPFVGLVSGSIYDDLITLDFPYLAYRLVNVGWVVAAWWLAYLWSVRQDASLVLRVGVMALVLGLFGCHLARGALGYEATRASIEEQLGGRLVTEDFEIVYDNAHYDEETVQLLLSDHRFRRHQIAAVLGTPFDGRIRSYLYADRAQKRRLMGAGRVFIAKPWNREVHLHDLHHGMPVLHHELAHVILAAHAPGPLGVPALWGVVPDMVLVEGVAYALEWRGDRWTPHEWSAAMRRAGRAADLRTLFSGDAYVSHDGPKAYTLSGSFIRWLLDSYGAASFLQVYGGASWLKAYDVSLETLVTRWEAFLDGLEVPEDAIALASARFRRPPVLQRVCPLEVARLEAEAAQAIADRDLDVALRRFRKVIEHVPEEPEKRLSEIAVLAMMSRYGEAHSRYEAMVGMAGAGPVLRGSALGLVGDAAWRAGDDIAAREAYQAALASPLPEAQRRNLGVKLRLVGDAGPRQALGAYLLGDVEDGAPMLEAVARALPEDPLVLYLLGRRHMIDGRWDTASQVLALALPGLALGRHSEVGAMLYRECLWVAGRAHFLSNRLLAARTVFTRALELSPGAARSTALIGWQARVAWRRATRSP